MPTLLTLPPSRFLFLLVSLDLLAVTLALGTGVVLHEDPSAYTREGGPVTWLSFAHLIVTGGLAGIVFRLRTSTHDCPPLRDWRDLRRVWLLLAIGFLFLAVDEVARLHEDSFDPLVHRIFGLQETALSSRLDGMILLGYGALGVMTLYACRRELAAYREVLPLVTCGVILFVFMVGVDMVTERQDVFRALDVRRWWRWENLRRLMTGMEDALKICAEAMLLGSMYACAFITAARRDWQGDPLCERAGRGGRRRSWRPF